MWKIIEERRYEPFKSFKDLQERVELLPDPKQAVIKRILEELGESDKYKLFTA
jgi:putative nucleotide binding protein